MWSTSSINLLFNFFEKMFKEHNNNIPTLDGINFKGLTNVQSQLIEEPFSVE